MLIFTLKSEILNSILFKPSYWNGLGITLKCFVFLKVKCVVIKLNIYYSKIYERVLKSWVEIKFRIVECYEAL